MSRILQAANFVAPHSGGIRTVLRYLAHGYTAAGHHVITVTPGAENRIERSGNGVWITWAGLTLPATGYRLLRLSQVRQVAAAVMPDVVEVHDRSTLRGLGPWARDRGIRATVVSHERLDRLLGQWLPPWVSTRWLSERSNASLAAAFDTVVCTTEWAAEEFERLGATNLRRIPLGVDLRRFRPDLVDQALRSRLAPDGTALLVMVSRLSHEKRPDLAVRTVAELVDRGVPVTLAVAGDGPLAWRLRRAAAGLPVTFVGHLNVDGVASLLATADVALAPGPVETFGLAALEALATGTPVVANPESALGEVIAAGGQIPVAPTPAGFADAVVRVLDQPTMWRRAVSRSRAEQFDLNTMIAGFLTAHQITPGEARAA